MINLQMFYVGVTKRGTYGCRSRFIITGDEQAVPFLFPVPQVVTEVWREYAPQLGVLTVLQEGYDKVRGNEYLRVEVPTGTTPALRSDFLYVLTRHCRALDPDWRVQDLLREARHQLYWR